MHACHDQWHPDLYAHARPSPVLRTLICSALAGVWALLTASRMHGVDNPSLQAELIRWSTRWLIPSFLLVPVARAWYRKRSDDAQPSLSSRQPIQAMPTDPGHSTFVLDSKRFIQSIPRRTLVPVLIVL